MLTADDNESHQSIFICARQHQAKTGRKSIYYTINQLCIYTHKIQQLAFDVGCVTQAKTPNVQSEIQVFG